MRALAALLLCAGTATAEGPPPDYFGGVYERIGRSGETPPRLVNDLVRLIPDDAGGLRLTACRGDAATIDLRFDRFGDLQNLLSTPEGQPWLGCQFFNDMDNYPILACQGGDGSKLTLWPADLPAEACPNP